MLSLRPFSADPFREIDRLETDMNRMMRSLTSSLPQGGMSSELMTWNPVMDIKTTDREMMINMELPGVRKEDVNIEIDRVSGLHYFQLHRLSLRESKMLRVD